MPARVIDLVKIPLSKRKSVSMVGAGIGAMGAKNGLWLNADRYNAITHAKTLSAAQSLAKGHTKPVIVHVRGGSTDSFIVYEFQWTATHERKAGKIVPIEHKAVMSRKGPKAPCRVKSGRKSSSAKCNPGTCSTRAVKSPKGDDRCLPRRRKKDGQFATGKVRTYRKRESVLSGLASPRRRTKRSKRTGRFISG